jgi:hypothetical protein
MNYNSDSNVLVSCILVLLCSGIPSDFLDSPTLAPTVFQSKKQLTMPPHKRSKNLLSVAGWLNHEPAKSSSRESTKIWNHEPAKLWNHEPAKLWNHEPAKFRKWESAKFGNSLKSKFGGYEVWRFSCVIDSGTTENPSQRRYLKSPGLACEQVAGL